MHQFILRAIPIVCVALLCIAFSAKVLGYELTWLQVISPVLCLAFGAFVFGLAHFFGLVITDTRSIRW